MSRAKSVVLACCVGWLLLPAACVQAQDVFRDDEHLAGDRPEAWAMQRATAVTLMTSFGPVPALAPGQWQGALELGHIPGLSTDEQRVGFRGTKQEDLDKSPVFGRARVLLGLPGGWVAELGYTPSLEIDGLRADDLFAAAIGRRLVAGERFTLSARAFGQHGGMRGDITCPAELAGIEDSARNPYGCQAPSKDRVTLNHYGLELTAGWQADAWLWHAGVGAVRSEPEVQVDALTYDVRDRSRLVARDVLPFATVGVQHGLGERWSVGVEVLHVPLTVRRTMDADREREGLTSLRVQLRYGHP